jgi:hypothetical protein
LLSNSPPPEESRQRPEQHSITHGKRTSYVTEKLLRTAIPTKNAKKNRTVAIRIVRLHYVNQPFYSNRLGDSS